MEKEYYKKYYDFERNHWWFIARAKILESKIEKISNGKRDLKILNVGVATGQTTEMLQKFGTVVSLEYDKDCCEFLRNTLKMEVINGSITELPFDDSQFDLVCAFDVIEHVDEDKLGVQEMIRVAKNEGHVFVTVPAYMQLWSDHDVTNFHKRRYVMKNLVPLFPNQKDIVFKSYFNSILFLPIYLIRMVGNMFKSKKKEVAKSDFDLVQNKFVNAIMYRIFLVEKTLLKFLRFPFGVSIMLIYKKLKS